MLIVGKTDESRNVETPDKTIAVLARYAVFFRFSAMSSGI